MDTKKHFVITISREVGSGGRTVGRLLSEKLGIRYSDKEMVEGLVSKFGLTVYEIEKLKGQTTNWLADFFRKLAPAPSAKDTLNIDSRFSEDFRPAVTSDELFAAESEIIKAIAAEGSCVIAGRAGFFILKDCPNRLDVFITASRRSRIARVMRKQNLSEEQAGIVIDSIDKARENYVRRYTGGSRYDARNYDLVLSADGHTEEELADLILRYIKA